MPTYLHDDLRPILEQTHGVVVFHEQVIEMIAQFAGVTYAEADEARRALGDVEGMAETKLWFFPRALALRLLHAGGRADLEGARGVRVVRLLQGARGGVRAADLPVGLAQGALAGALPGRGAHPRPGDVPQAADPRRRPPVRHRGARPRRQRSEKTYVVEKVGRLDEPPPERAGAGAAGGAGRRAARRPRYGIRLALSEVKGISEAEVDRVVAARPSTRSPTSGTAPGSPGRWSSGWCWPAGSTRSTASGSPGGRPPPRHASPGATCCSRWPSSTGTPGPSTGPRAAAAGWPAAAWPRRSGRPRTRAEDAAARNSSDAVTREARRADRAARRWPTPGSGRRPPRQSQATRTPDAGRPRSSSPSTSATSPGEGEVSGLPEMDAEERMRAELEILGLDASRHVVDSYAAFLDALGVTRQQGPAATGAARSELLVAGVKVATQTPPIRSGRRVVFLTLDDATGPVDATFFEDAQGPYAATVFHSWLLVVRGELRRTGRRGVSLRATGCWELPALHALWQRARHRRGARGDGRGARGLRRRGRRRRRRRGGREPGHPAGGGQPARAADAPATQPATAPPGHGPAPGAGALQRLPDVALRRHQAGRRGDHARSPASCGTAARGARDERPATARVGPMSASERSERPSERRAAARTAVVWAALREVLDSPGRRPRHRRRHRRLRGPGRRARPPGHGRRPQPRRPGRPRPPRPARAGSPTGSPASRATCPACSTWSRPRAPTWCSATASSSRRRPRRRARHDRRGAPPRRHPQPARRPAARRRGRPGDGRPLRRRPAPCSTPTRRGRQAPAAGSPPTRSPRCSPTPASPPRPCTASGSSPTWSPARCSTSSPAPARPWSSSSRPSPTRPEYLPLATQVHVVATRR